MSLDIDLGSVGGHQHVLIRARWQIVGSVERLDRAGQQPRRRLAAEVGRLRPQRVIGGFLKIAAERQCRALLRVARLGCERAAHHAYLVAERRKIKAHGTLLRRASPGPRIVRLF